MTTSTFVCPSCHAGWERTDITEDTCPHCGRGAHLRGGYGVIELSPEPVELKR